MISMPIAKDGWRFVLPSSGLTILFFVLHYWGIAVTLCLLTIFIVYFFRDPERKIPEGDNLIISPADGKVVEITRGVKHPDYGEEGTSVGIFLSIFNVHINRLPCSGRILTTRYNAGKFLPAFRDKVSDLNEHNCVIIENKDIKVQVKQIAGLIARRIVCWVKPGDEMKKGDRFGLIRFGSRVDIWVPNSISVCVEPGDKVKGGESVIGKFS